MRKTTNKSAVPKKKPAASKKRAAPKVGPSAAAVKKILKNVEKKMKGDELKATLGDYIRLIQFSKEMADEAKTDIKVTWVDEPKPTGE